MLHRWRYMGCKKICVAGYMDKHMKRRSVSLVVSEMQIKTRHCLECLREAVLMVSGEAWGAG